jgi:hypothetical protein
MIYPLIEKTNEIHIIKDINECECGFKFSTDIQIKRKTLRKIKFIDIRKVTCEKCFSNFHKP